MTKADFDKLYNEKLAQCLSDETVKFNLWASRDNINDLLPNLVLQQLSQSIQRILTQFT